MDVTNPTHRSGPKHLRSSAFICGSFFLMLLSLVPGCGSGVGGNERPGEIVMYGETSRISGFDPVKASDVASALAVSRIYECLLQYSYLARPYRVEPCLAEALPQFSPDGLTCTFRIRKGICFQDDPCFKAAGGKGREVTAEDFVYSIKRMADIRNESTGYWAFNERIVGLDDFREASKSGPATDYGRPVEGLTAPDRYTFRLQLTRPYPQLLWVLTMSYAAVVPREAVEAYGDDFLNHPVGTGPYRLGPWTRNYRIEFVRNPRWRETGRVELYPSEGEPGDREKGLLADAGKPIPFVDRIVQFVIDDESSKWLMFVAGQLETSGISRDNWNAVITPNNQLTDNLTAMGIKLLTTPTLDTFYIGFNMEDPVVGRNKKLRQALSAAFNTEQWITYWNHRIIRATGPIPPGVAGHEGKPSPYGFDLAKARKLMAEAGYPDGRDPATGRKLQLALELGNANDPTIRQAVELLADFESKLGIIINPSYNNWPTFLDKLGKKQVQMFWLGWVADYPDAENFLQLFYGPNRSPGPNHANYANPEFDALYEKIRVMPDSPERTEIYKRMAGIIIEDCPWLFLHHPMAYGLQHSWVKNYKNHDFPYGMSKYQTIDTEARRAWNRRFGKSNWMKL